MGLIDQFPYFRRVVMPGPPGQSYGQFEVDPSRSPRKRTQHKRKNARKRSKQSRRDNR